MSILEEKKQTKGREGGKTLTEREKSKTADYYLQACGLTKLNYNGREVNNCHCAILALIVKVLDLFKAPGVRCSCCCYRRHKLSL